MSVFQWTTCAKLSAILIGYAFAPMPLGHP
ncbi:hypothetical protein U746_3124 [Mycolicibacterium mucogenicum 261Sha1.1M5]|nr:hypothetical protein U746_3124 [Mycolicibacterium mucogenicum 261Sha1.1M5]